MMNILIWKSFYDRADDYIDETNKLHTYAVVQNKKVSHSEKWQKACDYIIIRLSENIVYPTFRRLTL